VALIRNRSAALLTALALALLAGPARADTRDQQISKARAFAEKMDVAKLTLFFAHPEAEYRSLTLTGTADVTRGGRTVDGAFALIYEYTWRSPLSGDTNRTKLALLFLENASVEVQAQSTTSFFQPFTNTDLILDFVKDQIRKDEKLSQDRALMRLVENGDARGMLGFFLSVGWLANK
jgi:hypothetical protein